MREVLLTDVALWGALIVAAALIIIGRWRRSHSRMPARGSREEAPEPAGQKVSPPKPARTTELGEGPRKPDRAAPKSARPAPVAPPKATEMADPRTRPHRPPARRDDRQGPARAATPGERIASYYHQADQPIADYLAELGWAEQPPTPPVEQDPQIRVLPQSPQAERPLRNTSGNGHGTGQAPRPHPNGAAPDATDRPNGEGLTAARPGHGTAGRRLG